MNADRFTAVIIALLIIWGIADTDDAWRRITGFILLMLIILSELNIIGETID